MGDTGPCGPSSEIFWDYGPEVGPEGGPANPAAEDRYVEIWNLVFPQYLRGADGTLSDLPSRNIDTGAGLERIMAVLAGSPSLYGSDILAALVDEAQSVTGHRLGESELGDIALRLMADHARTMTFLVADGVIPSNEDRGYVLRRIIRRAIRFAYLLGVERPVLPAMVERTIDLMGGAYPVVVEGRDLVLPIIGREEESFRRTLATGSQILDTQLDRLEPGGTLPGAVPSSSTTPTASRSRSPRRRPTCGASAWTWPASSRRWTTSGPGPGPPARAGASPPATRSPVQQRLLADHGPTEFTGRDEYESTGHRPGGGGRRRVPRPHAVLRRVRRPDRRHRHHHHRHRRARRGRHRPTACPACTATR